MDDRKDPSLSDIFYSEVKEQPDSMLRLVRHHRNDAGPLAACAETVGTAKGVVYLVGMGASEAAARTGEAFLTGQGVRAVAREAGEFLHYGIDTVRGREDVIVLISVSGRSAEIVKLKESLPCGTDIVVLTDDLASPVAKDAGKILKICSGEERATSSKTFSNTVALLLLLGRGIESVSSALELVEENALDLRSSLVTLESRQSEITDFLGGPSGFLEAVGRGPCHGVVFYGLLILRELFQAKGMYYPAGTYRHGPILDAGEDTRLIVLSEGRTRSLSTQLARDIAAKGGKALVLYDGVNSFNLEHGFFPLSLQGRNKTSFYFTAAALFQHIALSWTRHRQMQYVRRITVEE